MEPRAGEEHLVARPVDVRGDVMTASVWGGGVERQIRREPLARPDVDAEARVATLLECPADCRVRTCGPVDCVELTAVEIRGRDHRGVLVVERGELRHRVVAEKDTQHDHEWYG